VKNINTKKNGDEKGLKPRQIVEALNKYIIGQDRAKKLVAIALRNRARRRCLTEDLREEVYPKNIIMIGPTGVGKTEIARRLSRLADAPFVKVEATKYTEVGYVGRDVESMIRDLTDLRYSRPRRRAHKGAPAGSAPCPAAAFIALFPAEEKRDGDCL